MSCVQAEAGTCRVQGLIAPSAWSSSRGMCASHTVRVVCRLHVNWQLQCAAMCSTSHSLQSVGNHMCELMSMSIKVFDTANVTGCHHELEVACVVATGRT